MKASNILLLAVCFIAVTQAFSLQSAMVEVQHKVADPWGDIWDFIRQPSLRNIFMIFVGQAWYICSPFLAGYVRLTVHQQWPTLSSSVQSYANQHDPNGNGENFVYMNAMGIVQ